MARFLAAGKIDLQAQLVGPCLELFRRIALGIAGRIPVEVARVVLLLGPVGAVEALDEIPVNEALDIVFPAFDS